MQFLEMIFTDPSPTAKQISIQILECVFRHGAEATMDLLMESSLNKTILSSYAARIINRGFESFYFQRHPKLMRALLKLGASVGPHCVNKAIRVKENDLLRDFLN